MDEFNDSSEFCNRGLGKFNGPPMGPGMVGKGAGAEDHQGGPHSLATALNNVLRHLPHQAHLAAQAGRDDPINACELGLKTLQDGVVATLLITRLHTLLYQPLESLAFGGVFATIKGFSKSTGQETSDVCRN